MILAIDPGVTTGFATENGGYQLRCSHLELFEQLQNYKNSLDFLLYEAFHWRQGQLKTVFTGVEYIGVIELWAQQAGLEIRKINPSDGKGFWDNEKIRALGLYKPGCPHGMDAMRLLLTWKSKHDPNWKLQALNRISKF